MTTYTTSVNVTAAAYVSLGNGPLEVSLLTNPGVVSLIVSDSQPSASAVGILYATSPDTPPKISFTETSQVWAIAPNGATTIEVTTGMSSPLPTGAAQDGTDATGVVPPTGAVGIRGWLSGIYNKLMGTVAISGIVTATDSGALTNPTSTLTLPSTTTAYSAGQLAANSATAASVVVPSFSIANSAGGALIPRLRLSTNDTTSTGWGGVSVQVDLWLAAPTFTNGDRGAWSPATGTANHLASFTGTMSSVYGDGAYCELSPSVGQIAVPKLASGVTIYWTLQAVSATGVTGASKTFTLTAELMN